MIYFSIEFKIKKKVKLKMLEILSKEIRNNTLLIYKEKQIKCICNLHTYNISSIKYNKHKD